MTGVRVITYTDSDAKKVSRLIQDSFEILPDGVVDKSKELGVDRVGYRSIHCVGTLGEKRLGLPENSKFKGMCFEIQVRSILQHAWAEFEHDRNYKFSGVLPNDLKRRLLTVAGTLELVDREFDSISASIDNYSTEVTRKAELGDLNVSINTVSLIQYMSKRFQPLVELGVEPDLGGGDEYIISQLSGYGIDTTQKLEKMIPEDYIERKKKYIYKGITFLSILNDFLAISNLERFIESIRLRQVKGISMPEKDFLFLKEMYNIDIEKMCINHGLGFKTYVLK